MASRISPTLVLLTAVAGCAAPGSAATSPCVLAAEHVAACTGEPAVPAPTCDEAVALEVLESDCAELTAAGKADLFGDLLCRLGFLYRCPDPVCEGLEEAAAGVDVCEDWIDAPGCASCEYYRCRDAARPEPCGAEGYYLGFGGHYCDVFSIATAPRMSDQGRRWIDDVRTCLQESMVGVGDEVSCAEVREIAYAAHPGCYVGTGFCELPFTDMLAVLNTVEPRDLGIQPFQTAWSCVGRWLNPETGELTEEGLDALDAELAAP